jgi:glycerol-3-phosphate acyltransferase PlsY
MDATAVLLVLGPIVLAYLIGAIPFGIVVARLSGGPDPRSQGSGRTGGANVLRAMGFRMAAVAGLLDVAKGMLATAIPLWLGAGSGVAIACALAAIIGHSRSVYIGFGGGRGVSPGLGGLLVLAPLAALVALPVFVLVFAVSRISSLASLSASAVAGLAMLVIALATRLPVVYLVYAVAGAGLIWLFHHDNIARLLAGQERRFDLRR